MFLRIRGKGASPENSQAALLHLRGFRHTHTRPIKATYRVATTAEAGHHADALQREFTYTHFPIGIQSTVTLEAQHVYLKDLRAAQSGAGADAATAASPAALEDPSAAVLHAISDDTQRMVWKETWNVYDIVYDEVNLMPADFEATNALLKALHQAEHGAATEEDVLTRELPNDYIAPRRTSGNKLVLVSTHYYRKEVIPLEVWETCHSTRSSPGQSTTATGADAVVVIDLSGVEPALAYQKLALELAWSVAYATTQADNPLLRAAALVIRLPYDDVPCSVAWLAAHKASPGCAAVLEMYDFIGQHIALVYNGLWLGCPALQALSDTGFEGPPLHFIGAKTRLEDDAVLQALVHQAKTSEVDTSRAATTSPHVVVLSCDTNVGLAKVAERTADAWGVPVSVLAAPVKALVDGGDEPWDPYTLKERERLNFCPCCGDCDHTKEGSEAGHGHGHGHGHAH